MKTIITAAEIAGQVAKLGREISAHYRGRPFTMLVLLNGAMVFAADLLRAVDGEVELDTMKVASYAGTASTGRIEYLSKPKLPAAGRHILVVDDIYDTGLTFREIGRHLREAGAAEVRFCTLVNKCRDKVPGAPAPDFCAFEIPDVYVVGYGLDADEKHRNRPDIADFLA